MDQISVGLSKTHPKLFKLFFDLGRPKMAKSLARFLDLFLQLTCPKHV